MARIQAGDRGAFDQLVRRHLNAIHAYALRLSGSPADADDLSQETFMRIWQKASTYRFEAVRVTTWMHQIAHNVFVDSWRRREPTQPLDDETIDTVRSPEPYDDDATQWLQLSIARLPLGQRTAVSLALFSGFSADETGHIMGISTHAVESLIARARRTLRQVVRQPANESGSCQ